MAKVWRGIVGLGRPSGLLSWKHTYDWALAEYSRGRQRVRRKENGVALLYGGAVSFR